MARRSRFWQMEGFDYKFRSRFECEVAEQLIDLDVQWTYEEEEWEYSQKINGTCMDCEGQNVHKNRVYTPDFKVMLPDHTFYIEAKGNFTGPDRTKMVAVKETYPDVDIRMFFQADNWITKLRKRTYGGWCGQKGFVWACAEIPTDWVE